MSENLQIVVVFLVMQIPTIVIHFSLRSARSDMKEAVDKPCSNPNLPELDYGKGQSESIRYDKLKSGRKISFVLCLLASVIFYLKVMY
jgi:hypothetical protein